MRLHWSTIILPGMKNLFSKVAPHPPQIQKLVLSGKRQLEPDPWRHNMNCDLSEAQRAIREKAGRLVEHDPPRAKVVRWVREKVEPRLATHAAQPRLGAPVLRRDRCRCLAWNYQRRDCARAAACAVRTPLQQNPLSTAKGLDTQMGVEATRTFTYRSAAVLAKTGRCHNETSCAKVICSEICTHRAYMASIYRSATVVVSTPACRCMWMTPRYLAG